MYMQILYEYNYVRGKKIQMKRENVNYCLNKHFNAKF